MFYSIIVKTTFSFFFLCGAYERVAPASKNYQPWDSGFARFHSTCESGTGAVAGHQVTKFIMWLTQTDKPSQ